MAMVTSLGPPDLPVIVLKSVVELVWSDEEKAWTGTGEHHASNLAVALYWTTLSGPR